MKLQELFNQLDAIFHFDLDVAADLENHKTPKYLTKFENGLTAPWEGRAVWCNPPHDVTQLPMWMARCMAHEGLAALMLPIADPLTKSLMMRYVWATCERVYFPQ